MKRLYCGIRLLNDFLKQCTVISDHLNYEVGFHLSKISMMRIYLRNEYIYMCTITHILISRMVTNLGVTNNMRLFVWQ